MSIHELTVRKQIEAILQDFYKSGRIPKPVEFERAVNDFFTKYPPGRPRLKLRPQKRKSRLNIDHFNTQTLEIDNDLEILYEGLVSIIESMTRHVASSQGVSSVLSKQLDTLKDALDSLIATYKHSNSYLMSYTESFNDLSGIDIDATTATIDLESKSCTLRRMVNGSNRLKMDHMIPTKPDEEFITPVVSIVEGKDVVLRSSSQFYNCLASFGDNAYVRTYSADPSGGPVTIRIEFPLSPHSLPRISRLDIKTLDVVKLRLLYTNENREERSNWLYFPGFEGQKRIEKPESFTFEDRDVAWIRLEFTFDSPTSVINGISLYQLGIERLEFYNQGYASESILETVPFLPAGSEFMSRLGKITLDVTEKSRPAGTDVQYFIQLQEPNSPWIPITPVNFPTSRDSLRVVDFGGSIVSPRRDNSFMVASSDIHRRKNAIDYYKIKQLDKKPVFGSANLYHTIGTWKQSSTLSENLLSVTHNYIVFTQTDSDQNLYLTKRDEVPRVRDVNGKAYLDLSEEVIVQDGMRLVAPNDQSIEQNPYYSIERVLRLSRDNFVAGNAASIIRHPKLYVEVRLNTVVPNNQGYINQYVYLNDGVFSGYFKVSDVIHDANGNTALILYDVGNLHGEGSVGWRFDIQDVSSSVVSVSGRVVETSEPYNQNDRFLVTYRHKLSNRQTLVEGSVRLRIANANQDAVDGVDYAVDYVTKSVRRLSNAVNAGGGTTVYATASFQIRELVPENFLYSTYAYIGSKKDINLRSLSLDKLSGEYFQIIPITDNSIRRIDDASSGGRITLSGIVQFVVSSKPIRKSDGSFDTSSAIFKVINLKDSSGNYLFDPGRYFDRIEAQLEPAEQVTYTRLLALPPNSYDAFSVLDDNSIVVNFDPLNRRDLIFLLPGQTIEQTYRNMEISFSYIPDGSTEKRLKLRAVLSRDRNTSGSITPVIESFTVRYS